MKLAAKIFTALAIAFAISYVAARDYTPDASAAAGQIDVLNVGTCYATSSEVFDEGDCDDNLIDNDQYNLAEQGAPGGAGIRDLKTRSRVYATYAVDPRTSSQEPRAVLLDSDLIKISISDPGRDRRTPVLLRAGGASADDRLPTGGSSPTMVDCYTDASDTGSIPNQFRPTPKISPSTATLNGAHRELCAVYKEINDRFFQTSPNDALLDFGLQQSMVQRGSESGNVQYTASRASNNIVDVQIPAGAPDTEDFLPLHVKLNDDGESVHDDTVIRWYGYLIHATGGTVKPGGCVTVTPTQAAAVEAGFGDDGDETRICDLSRYIGLDEDIGSGRAKGDIEGEPTVHTAPYITFNVSLPGAHQVRVRYVYYETSKREDLLGGAFRSSSATIDNYDSSDDAVVDADGAQPPVFVDAETSTANRQPMLVRAQGDGADDFANLWLRETGRFDGRYEGYLRLTDDNGDHVQPPGGDREDNWGRETGDATGEEIADAAVLGVEAGPVTIEYRDSDGSTQELEVAIDVSPPVIEIDSPAYKENFDSQRVLVTGTFTDGESGLRDDSFRLYLDNIDDDDEDGENNAERTVLRLGVDGQTTEGGSGKEAGYVDIKSGADVVELIGDYRGFEDDKAGITGTNGLFGVLRANWLYRKLTKNTETDGTGEDYDALKTIDPDSYSDGASEAIFNDIARLDLVDGTGDSIDDLNNQIDFQALVLDLAGNVGFSDSDPDGPTFIHDYGTEADDRKAGRYNVLGWYARHIISIDQVDPRLGRVVTGFYGEDDDDEPQSNDRGLMLMFDGAIDASSVDTGTFTVQLDPVGDADPVNAVVADVEVEGNRVYLLLSEDLLSDATPKLSVARGRSVSDPAGNSLTSNDDLNDDDEDGGREIESTDGIRPSFTVTLLKGSGMGTGDEGPGRLTKESIIVRVSSNENITGAPYVVVACNGFTWQEDVNDTPNNGEDDVTRDLQDVVDNRSGKTDISAAANFAPKSEVEGFCDDDDQVADLSLHPQRIHTRPGNVWEWTWKQNTSGTPRLSELPDGKVTVVAFGRDRSDWYDDYKPGEATAGTRSFNWGAETAEFELDTELRAPTEAGFGSVQPNSDGVVFESRPFVLLTFKDESTVSIKEDGFKIGGTVQEITALGNNRFLYWPESLSFGEHKVEVDAIDAAENERSFSYDFEVKARTAFKIGFLAGWNAVSVPAMPVSPSIDDVFQYAEVDQVVGWDSSTPDAPWRIATKVDDEWVTNSEFAPLNTIEAGKGYWVHAHSFFDQPVMLTGVPDREVAANAPAGPIGIQTVKGWNFVGVVDTDGDQTQAGDFGKELKNSKEEMVTATQYLRKYKQAYTWDPIESRFNVVEGGDSLDIGDGIWVYYADGFNVAP